MSSKSQAVQEFKRHKNDIGICGQVLLMRFQQNLLAIASKSDRQSLINPIQRQHGTSQFILLCDCFIGSRLSDVERTKDYLQIKHMRSHIGSQSCRVSEVVVDKRPYPLLFHPYLIQAFRSGFPKVQVLYNFVSCRVLQIKHSSAILCRNRAEFIYLSQVCTRI